VKLKDLRVLCFGYARLNDSVLIIFRLKYFVDSFSSNDSLAMRSKQSYLFVWFVN